MPLWHKRLTDQEYVDRARRDLVWHRWLRVGLGVLGIFSFIATVYTGQVMIKLLVDREDLGFVQHTIYLVLGTAALFGFMFGLLFMQSLFMVGLALFDKRKDRMLVELWDRQQHGESLGD